MARPLSFVRLDIAHFGIEISDRPDDKTLADWVRKFHRALALQDSTICEFASKLLNECAEFRAIDANRKRIPKESSGIQWKDMESTTDQIIAEHTDQIKSGKEKREPLKRFQPPTVFEVAEYCKERKNSVNPEKFIAHYESNGWKVGKNPMKSWKAAVVSTWEQGPQFSTQPSRKSESFAVQPTFRVPDKNGEYQTLTPEFYEESHD